MRVSEYYKLGLTQPSLDFIDVNVDGDTPLFLDPRALRSLRTIWGNECVSLLQSFFGEVLDRIKKANIPAAKQLLSSLSEPNETRLGLSSGAPSGRGWGWGLAEQVANELVKSKAATTGLLRDLEDSSLFIRGIGHDRISDLTTNIIRERLIEFTQDSCVYYGIPLHPGVNSGRLWDAGRKRWRNVPTSLPIASGRPLVLVPKSIVRFTPAFDPGEYYRDFVLPMYQDFELRTDSRLVVTLKKGGKKVYKKAVDEKYRQGRPVKDANVDGTQMDPSILDKYRSVADAKSRPLTHRQVAAATQSDEPDWDALLADVLTIPPGAEHADDYHRAVEALLTPLFYPSLDMPMREHRIHDGRKRIDISYTNIADSGFFYWLHDVHKAPCGQVPVECKNYGQKLANPEFDQLTGRFGHNRGVVGMLIHRGFGNKRELNRRARDVVSDSRGYVIVLDDDDLKELVKIRKTGVGTEFSYLMKRFRELI